MTQTITDRRLVGVRDRAASRVTASSATASLERTAEGFRDAARSSGVVAAVAESAWVQETIRVFGAVTNLSLAHTRIAVVGTGPIARSLARELQRIGSRVIVAGGDPAALVRLSSAGFEIALSATAAAADATVLFSTGEDFDPIDAAFFGGPGTLVLVDAAVPGARRSVVGVLGDSDPHGRPDLTPLVGAERDVFLIDIEAARGSGFDQVVADIEGAFVLLLRDEAERRGTPDGGPFPDDLVLAADAALAELVIA